jgi:hypothetical protein
MFITKRLAVIVAVALVVAVGVFGFGTRQAAVEAQDSKVACDLTLLTLLYISEHEYGHFPMTDITNLDKGQYTPLFEAMMAEMAEMTPTEEPEMVETEMPEMTETEEAPSEYTQLPHGDIPGEDQLCTDLRHELDSWFLEHFKHMMMKEEE